MTNHTSRNRWILSAATVSLASATVVMVAVASASNLVVAHFGVTPGTLGVFMSGSFVAAVAVLGPTARMLEDLSSRRSLILPPFVTLIGLVVLGVSNSSTALLVGLVLGGISIGAAAVITNVNVAGNIEIDEGRGRAMGIKQTGMPVTSLLLAPLVPTLAVRWSLVTALMAVAAVVGLGALVIVAGTRWQGTSTTVNKGETGSIRVPNDPDNAPRTSRLIGVYGFVMASIQLAFVTYLVLYLVDVHGLSDQGAGYHLFIASGAGIVGRVLWGHLSDRGNAGGRAHTLMYLGIATALGATFLAITPPGAVLPLVAAALLLGASSLGWNGVFNAALVDQSRSHGRSSARGLRFNYTGALVGPVLFGFVIEQLNGYRAAWGVLAVLALTAAASGWVVKRRERVPFMAEQNSL